MSNSDLNQSLWPYDELRLSIGQGPHQFILEAPWVSLKLNAADSEIARLKALVGKFQAQSFGPGDREELSWFLGSLSHFPLAYYLPRIALTTEGLDQHRLRDSNLMAVNPAEFLKQATPEYSNLLTLAEFSEWNWPHDDALAFSRITPSLYDPYSLFSVARRFSLVEASEVSETNILFEKVTALKNNPEKHKEACAIIVRQNHFVTENCHASLLPALGLAQSVKSAVDAFIRSELGHDTLLLRAIQSLGKSPGSLQVVPASHALMALLKFSGSSNFLAFALVVDIFERSTYGERDPLALLLDSAGLSSAAKQIDIHKGINDSGAHDNIALSFLRQMAPVDAAYAKEALCFAEAISFLVQQVSREVATIVG